MLRTVVLLSASLMAVATLPDESALDVIQPAKLQAEFPTGMHHSEALFGIPKYGQSLDALTYPVMNGSSLANGCTPFASDPAWDDKAILVLQRNSVANAQRAGAAAALIVNNKPVCGLDVDECPMGEGTWCHRCFNVGPILPNPNNCDCVLPLMADDHEHSVDIPSFLITKTAGAAILACSKGEAPCDEPTTAVMHMQWSLPAPDDRVEWSLWGTAANKAAETFREQFISLVPRLGSSVQFTPEYFIYDGESWGCTRGHNCSSTACGAGCNETCGLACNEQCGSGCATTCATQCINSGRYCSPDPDSDLFHGVSGADVVMENLRQMCIFEQANETVLVDNALRYWRYTQLFSANCEHRYNATCSQEQVEAAGLSWAQVAQCMAESGDAAYPCGGSNSRLEMAMQDRDNLYIVNLPTVVINNVIERGTITPTSVLRTLCSGFQLNKPDVCECAPVDSHWLSVCAESGPSAVPPQFGGTQGLVSGSSGLPGWAAFLIVLLVIMVVALAVGGLVAYRRTHANFRNMLEDYRRLEGEDDTTQMTAL